VYIYIYIEREREREREREKERAVALLGLLDPEMQVPHSFKRSVTIYQFT
jgi:hypothetical protein